MSLSSRPQVLLLAHRSLLIAPSYICQEPRGSIDLHKAGLTTDTAPGAPVPMNAIWRTIRSYVLWQHERGTLHYDIMVTLIILFVLFSPLVINFNDKPISRNPHPTEVLVTAEADGHLSFQVAANAVTPGDDLAMRDQLLHIIEPIAGAVSIVSYEAVSDRKGQVQSYKVLAERE